MGCTYKIKEGLAIYTETERKLAEYILEHKLEVVNDSAQVLGEKVNTSAAAVVRFAKRLGYKGFTAMKVDLAKDNSDHEYDFDEIMNETDSTEVLVKKSYASNIRTLEQTYNMINVQQVEKAITMLLNCRNIYLFGVGGSGVVCDDFLHKLSRINRSVIYHHDTHIQLASSTFITNEDVALAISYSGNTKEVNIPMAYANKVGAKTIAITKFSKNKLSKIADVNLYVPSEEKELRLGAISSRFSSLILTDILYFGIAKNDLETTKERIIQTRELMNEFK